MTGIIFFYNCKYDTSVIIRRQLFEEITNSFTICWCFILEEKNKIEYNKFNVIQFNAIKFIFDKKFSTKNSNQWLFKTGRL